MFYLILWFALNLTATMSLSLNLNMVRCSHIGVANLSPNKFIFMPIFISFWFKMVADHLSENQASDNITHNLVPRVLSALNKAESRPTAMLKA